MRKNVNFDIINKVLSIRTSPTPSKLHENLPPSSQMRWSIWWRQIAARQVLIRLPIFDTIKKQITINKETNGRIRENENVDGPAMGRWGGSEVRREMWRHENSGSCRCEFWCLCHPNLRIWSVPYWSSVWRAVSYLLRAPKNWFGSQR